MSVNTFIGIGNLCQDVDLAHTPSGAAIAKFSIACNEVWYDKDKQKQEKVEFINVIVWGKQAESCAQYLSKGKKIYLSGKLTTEMWEKDGHKNYKTSIIAQKIEFLSPADKQPTQQTSQSPAPVQAAPSYFDDDSSVPF